MSVITLGGLALPSGLQWTNRHSSQAIQQTLDYALDGSPVIYSAAKSGGLLITLESLEDSGWFSQTQADAVMALANQVLGATQALFFSFDDYTAWVLFAHQTPPAVDLKPLYPASDRYIGRVSLITV